MWPGRSSPLGATFDGSGVNFALFSEHATQVELCLFDSPDAPSEAQRIALPEKTDQVWHGYLPDVRPGQIYGYRVHGPHDPARGHRFNPRKVLLDPYAKAIARELRWDDAVLDPDARHRALRAARPRRGHRVSTGAATSRRARPGTRRSSMNCTSKASPNNIPTCRRSCAALTRASLRPRPSSICASWA